MCGLRPVAPTAWHRPHILSSKIFPLCSSRSRAWPTALRAQTNRNVAQRLFLTNFCTFDAPRENWAFKLPAQNQDCAIHVKPFHSFEGENRDESRSCAHPRRMLLLLNTTQIIDNSEDAHSHDDFRALLRPGLLPIRRINIVRQVDNGVESFPPNWHFTSAVSGNSFRSVYGFINSVRGKDPVVVLGQHRQIGRRRLQLFANRSLALSIRTMTGRARRLKF
jgi:hypothetical protein